MKNESAEKWIAKKKGWKNTEEEERRLSYLKKGAYRGWIKEKN